MSFNERVRSWFLKRGGGRYRWTFQGTEGVFLTWGLRRRIMRLIEDVPALRLGFWNWFKGERAENPNPLFSMPETISWGRIPLGQFYKSVDLTIVWTPLSNLAKSSHHMTLSIPSTRLAAPFYAEEGWKVVRGAISRRWVEGADYALGKRREGGLYALLFRVKSSQTCAVGVDSYQKGDLHKVH